MRLGPSMSPHEPDESLSHAGLKTPVFSPAHIFPLKSTFLSENVREKIVNILSEFSGTKHLKYTGYSIKTRDEDATMSEFYFEKIPSAFIIYLQV